MENKEVNLLDQVFVHSERYQYECSEEGIVTVLEPQDHKIQKFFRKIGFKIVENKRMELDAYGSYVYLLIDGKRTVREIGTELKAKYPEAGEYLYERLQAYLNGLYGYCHYIELVTEEQK